MIISKFLQRTGIWSQQTTTSAKKDGYQQPGLDGPISRPPHPTAHGARVGAFLEARRDRSFDWLGDGEKCEDTNLRALLSSPSPSIISFEGIAQTAPSLS